MGVCAMGGDKFFGGMVNKNKMLVGTMDGRPQVAPTVVTLCSVNVGDARC